MKKIILIISLFCSISFGLKAQTERTLKQVLVLKMTSDRGANAAGVVWHPIQKKYYAALAGNEEHQMGVYDVKGKMLSKETQQTLFDVRGLWYNPVLKTLQGNGYSGKGWVEYKLDLSGMPVSVKSLFSGMNQPDLQSAGAFDPINNAVYFFDNTNGNIARHKMKETDVNNISTFAEYLFANLKIASFFILAEVLYP